MARQRQPRMLVARAHRHAAIRVHRCILRRGGCGPSNARRAASQRLSQYVAGEVTPFVSCQGSGSVATHVHRFLRLQDGPFGEPQQRTGRVPVSKAQQRRDTRTQRRGGHVRKLLSAGALDPRYRPCPSWRNIYAASIGGELAEHLHATESTSASKFFKRTL